MLPPYLLSLHAQIALHAAELALQGLRILNHLSRKPTTFGELLDLYDQTTWSLLPEDHATLKRFLGVCAHLKHLPDLGSFEPVLRTYALGTAPTRRDAVDHNDYLPHDEDLFQLWLLHFERALDLVLRLVP